MSNYEQFVKNVETLMFIYSYKKKDMKGIFGNGFFKKLNNKDETLIKKVSDYFNISEEYITNKDIINSSLNRRYFF